MILPESVLNDRTMTSVTDIHTYDHIQRLRFAAYSHCLGGSGAVQA
jgi:hypothetical protein